jgi:signal transduction histidine kinase
VRAALDTVRTDRSSRGRRPMVRGLGQALATELGVEVERLRDALRAVDGPKRARRGDAQDIATALGVDVAEVRTILRALREGEAARRTARQEAFAAALAHELGMPVTTVSEALSAMPARRGSRG